MIEQTYKVLAGRTACMRGKSVKGEMLHILTRGRARARS